MENISIVFGCGGERDKKKKGQSWLVLQINTVIKFTLLMIIREMKILKK